MARRHAHLQNAFSKGELDPLLYERTDLKHYYNALKVALNVEMLAQGGFRRRPGQPSLGRLRRRIEPIVLTAGMLAAPNGGTAANLIDGTSSALVTGAVSGTDFVVATVDLGSPKAVAFVDLIGFLAETLTQAASVTLNADATPAAHYYRLRIAAAAFAAGGDAVRLTLTPHSAASQAILNVFIGQASDVDPADFAAAPVRVTFNGGANGVTLTGGGAPVVSDIIPFSLDPARDHIVAIDFAPGTPSLRINSSATNFTTYAKAVSGEPVQEAHLIDVTGYTPTASLARTLSKIEVGFAKADVLTVEYEATPAGTWVPFSPGSSGEPLAYRDISAGARTRRFGRAPGTTVTAQKWRINVRNGSGAGAVSLQELRFWAEKAGKSVVRFLPFAYSLADFFTLALTEDNIDVWRGDNWVAAVPVTAPPALVELASTGWVQSEHTGLLLHEDYQPARAIRQGGDNEWNADFPAFSNVPLLSAPTTHLAQRFAVQRVEITGLAANDVILFGIRNSFTGSVTYSVSLSAATIEAAIEAAPNVDADGVTVTDLSTSGGALAFTVAFVNNNASQHWPRLVPYVLGNAAAAATVTVLEEGVSGSTPMMGAKTGWPRCGLLVQARLLLAGFKTFPAFWAASQNGALYDFALPSGSLALATDAIADKLATDQAETVRAIAQGFHLSLLTDSGEWYVENRTLNATEARNAVRPTGNGLKPGIPPVFADGALLFVSAPGEDEAEASGSVLRAFTLSEAGATAAAGAYTAEPLSLLGPHLLTDTIGLAWRKPRATKEGGLVIMPNADGTMALMTFLRAQDVVSLAKHATDGLYRAAAVNAARQVTYAVERTVGGVADNWLERRDAAYLLDAAVKKTITGSVVTGLAHIEGKTNAWAIAGGNPYGPFTVTGAQITLPVSFAAPTEVEVGLFFDVRARTLPLRPELPNDAKFKPPGRCYECEVSVVETGGFALSANGSAPRTIVTRDPAAPLLDTPMLEALLTGSVLVEDLEGWTEDVEVEISQPTPAPLTVRSLRMEVAY